MNTYQLVNNQISKQLCSISLLKDGIRIASIPLDPANTDAQAFAKWLKDGGTPEPAEEGGSVSAEWVTETIARLLP